MKSVPQFTEKVTTLIAQKEVEQVSVNYSHPSNGPTIIDEQSPSIKVIIWGHEVAGTIVDGGLGVNVTNKTTCDKLRITKWDTCPFWLRMANTSTIRALGIIWQLDVILGDHAFQISIVELHLDTYGGYPLLLGQPVGSTMVKNNKCQNQEKR